MFTRSLLWSLLLTFISFSAFAQPDNPQKVEGDDGAKEAAQRAEYLTNVHAYNTEVNNGIIKKSFYHHHIDVNRTGKKLGGVAATQSVDCYFSYENGNFTPVKILILTTEGNVNKHKEFLFDKTGELFYHSYNADLNDPDSDSKGFYFNTKQLIYYSDKGLVLPKAEYDTDVFEYAVNVLNEAEDYKLMLSTIIRVQPK